MWQLIIDFMLNIMIWLYQALGNNFILALLAFTAATRLILLPLSLRQQRSSLKMQEMQPQVQAIQKKYRDDQQKMMEEFQKIGYNPAESLLGCAPLLIQMPIFLALFRVINMLLLSSPQSLIDLKMRIGDGYDLAALFPIDNTFLWMNLAQPDPYLVMPLLVAGSMFLQQRLMMPPKKEEDKKKAQDDNPMAQTQQQMLYTMPIMFGFLAMSFNSGLAVYFVISNVIGIGQGYITRRSMAAEKEASAFRRAENERRAQEAYGSDEDDESKSDSADTVKKQPEKKNRSNGSSSKSNSNSKSNSSSKSKKRKKTVRLERLVILDLTSNHTTKRI